MNAFKKKLEPVILPSGFWLKPIKSLVQRTMMGSIRISQNKPTYIFIYYDVFNENIFRMINTIVVIINEFYVW